MKIKQKHIYSYLNKWNLANSGMKVYEKCNKNCAHQAITKLGSRKKSHDFSSVGFFKERVGSPQSTNNSASTISGNNSQTNFFYSWVTSSISIELTDVLRWRSPTNSGTWKRTSNNRTGRVMLKAWRSSKTLEITVLGWVKLFWCNFSFLLCQMCFCSERKHGQFCCF